VKATADSARIAAVARPMPTLIRKVLTLLASLAGGRPPGLLTAPEPASDKESEWLGH
jgi:hypothetical protein